MQTFGNPSAELARVEPGRLPPGPASPGEAHRPAEDPEGDPAPAPWSPFVRALLHALSVWCS